MIKKIFAVLLSFSIFLVSVTVSANTLNQESFVKNLSSNNTWYVPDDFSSIQQAIDGVNIGDTIIVKQGTYQENILIDKPINLIGENKETTIIDGGGSGEALNVSANYVAVSGFTIKSCKRGIKLYRSFGTVLSNNKINSNCLISRGIYLMQSDMNEIYDNVFSKNPYGIYLYYSNNNQIYNNIIKDSEMAMDVDHSNENIIQYNEILNNWYSVYLFTSNNNTINENSISNNEHGIFLVDSPDNKIINNELEENLDYGIAIDNSKNNGITGNMISFSNVGIEIVFSGNYNRNELKQNNEFYSNGIDVIVFKIRNRFFLKQIIQMILKELVKK